MQDPKKGSLRLQIPAELMDKETIKLIREKSKMISLFNSDDEDDSLPYSQDTQAHNDADRDSNQSKHKKKLTIN